MILSIANPPVDICLATYNGERFLEEQLESLKKQTYDNWKIIVRDDCSSDSTPDILSAFALQNPGRMQIIESTERLGVIANFSAALSTSQAPYVFLCDQDDVWYPEKIADMIKEMHQLEEQQGTDHPILLHSDLAVVDVSLKVIHPSFWNYTRLKPTKVRSLARLLPQNCVTGCATLCNRALLQLALPISPSSLMHDWWLALTAAAFGTIAIYPHATISYRQHGNNTLGAKRAKFPYSLLRLLFDRGHVDVKKRLQAQSFQERFLNKLSSEQRLLVSEYIALPDKGRFSRAFAICRFGYTKQGFMRQMAFLLGLYN